MLITFAVLTAAAAVSPVVWFSWWLLADAVESRRARRVPRVVAMRRDVPVARAHRERAA